MMLFRTISMLSVALLGTAASLSDFHQGSKHALPSTFEWKSTGPLIGPKSDYKNLTAIKDPSIIFHEGKYHVFVSTIGPEGYNMAYFSFLDFHSANSSTFYYLDETPISTGYRAAPQVFFFEPQQLWYLVFQDGNAGYSTNPNIDDPQGWAPVKDFFATVPDIINEDGTGWLDMWVICDEVNCFHFSENDNGYVFRAQTSIADFPNNFTQPVVALYDSNPDLLYEASNVYHIDNEYLLIVECIGSDGRRFFRSWTSSTLDGEWTPLADTQQDPFAGAANVVFPGESVPWTDDISHGEMIRTRVDQTMTISPCNLQYLYQGLDPSAGGDYNSLPWRLALLTQTNSLC